MRPDQLALVRERVYSAYHWIFVRCATQFTDAEILDKLHIAAEPLGTYESMFQGLPRASVAIGRCGEWIGLADDASYTIWNSQQTIQRIRQMAATWDVLQYFIADCDNSHSLRYFRSGLRVREWLVLAGPDDDYIVHTTHGKPLPREEPMLTLECFSAVVGSLKESLGIVTDFRYGDLQFYTHRRAR